MNIEQKAIEGLRKMLPFALSRLQDIHEECGYCKEWADGSAAYDAACAAVYTYDAQQAAAPAGDHTEETWTYDGAHVVTATLVIARVYGEANARRIVACVNACKGIDTALLESGSRDDVAAELLALHNFGDKA